MKPLLASTIRTFVVLVSIVALLFIMLGIGRADPFISYGYQGDGLLNSAIIQTLLEKGSYLETERLGAPVGQKLYDFPMADGFNYLLIWLIGSAAASWAFALNGFFLLTFPLAGISALFVLRKMGVTDSVAVALAILYAFLPYHLMRGEGHLLLSAYYMVPLLCWVAWTVASGVWAFDGAKFRIRLFVQLSVVCLVGSSTGVYYAFFGAMAVLFFSIVTWINTRHHKNFFVSVALVAILGVGTVVNILPNLIYSWQNKTSISTQRSLGESEIYGLKLAQMVLPRTGHNFPPFASVREAYNRSSPLTSENDMAALGLVGSLGLLVSLGAVFLRGRRTGRQLALLGRINGLLIMVAMIGGFAIFIGFALTKEIRAYNRISVFIGFFSLAAVGLLLTQLYQKFAHFKWASVYRWLLMAPVVVFGIYDQVPLNVSVDGYKNKVAEDREFFSSIERQLEVGSAVFQLPYMPFPESPPIWHMADYEHLRGYLNTKSLRWSYGAFKGSEGDRIVSFLSKSEKKDGFLNDLVLGGYSGLFINRDGYADKGLEIETRVSATLGLPPQVSSNGKMAFFDLTKLAGSLREDRLKHAEMLSEFVDRRDGVYTLGTWITAADEQWLSLGWSTREPTHRWTEGKEAKLTLKINKTTPAQMVKLEIEPQMVLGTQRVDVWLNDKSLGALVLQGTDPVEIVFPRSHLAAPGMNQLRLKLVDARPPGNGDPRVLSFALGRIRLDNK